MPRIKIKYSLSIIIALIILVFASHVFAVTSSDLRTIRNRLNELESKKERCERLSGQPKINCINRIMPEMNKLNNQLMSYYKEVESKTSKLEQDVQSLKNQVGYIDAQTEKKDIQISVTEQEMNLTYLDISKTEEEIKETTLAIKNTKRKLGESVKNFYEYDKKNIIAMAFTEGNISDVFNEIIYIEKLQQEISGNVAKLKERRKFLKQDKISLEKNIENLDLQVESYDRQITEMGELKEQKSDLLEITKGDEVKYKELLAKVAAQKNELLGELSEISQAKKKEIAKLIEKTGGRLCNHFGIPYYAQNSGSWANKYINNIPPFYYKNQYINTRMKYNGCAITSATMILKYYGKNVSPETLRKDKRILSGILIKFYDVGKYYGITCGAGCGPGTNINWGTVDRELKARHPVILMISSPKGTHFIVATGKTSRGYIVNDPLNYVGCGVNLKASLQNVKNYAGSAKVTRMILWQK